MVLRICVCSTKYVLKLMLDMKDVTLPIDVTQRTSDSKMIKRKPSQKKEKIYQRDMLKWRERRKSQNSVSLYQQK